MKNFLIEWETDYCDNFPEHFGELTVEAESENEAIEKFYSMNIRKACLSRVTEVNKYEH